MSTVPRSRRSENNNERAELLVNGTGLQKRSRLSQALRL